MARREDAGGVHDPADTPTPTPKPKSTQPHQNSGGGTSQNGTDRVFQSSERGKPLSLAFGTVRVAPNIIERFDSLVITSTAPYWTPDTDYLVLGNNVRSQGNNYILITVGHSSATGTLGNGPGGTGDDIVDGTAHWRYIPPGVYTALVLGFCEGEAYGVGKAWQDSFRMPDYHELTGISANWTLFLGTPSGVTKPDWFPAGSDPLPDYYSNTVVLFISGTSGADATVPNVSLEVQGIFADATHVDVSPADIALDMLTHPRRGVLWPLARVDSVSTGDTDPASWRNYCTAYGLNLSWVIDTQTDVLTLLGLLLDATNSDAIQTNRPDGLGFMLKFVPRGDEALTANGATFTPITAATAIGPDDLLEPVRPQRSPPIDHYNSCPVEYVDRGGDYVRTTVDDPEMADVELRGLRRATTFSLPQVIAPESAIMLSRIRAQRSLNVTSTYTLKLPDRFLLLEPTDLLTVSDPVMGLVNVPMRVTAIGEGIGEGGGVTVTAEDWPGLVHAAAAYTPQAGDGYKPNQATPISRSPVLPDQVPPGTIADAATTRGGAVDNMWPNPTSETSPPDGADLTTAEWVGRVQDAGAPSGSWVRQLTESPTYQEVLGPDGGANYRSATQSELGTIVPCTPGASYHLEALARISSVGAGGLAGCNIYFLDNTGTGIGIAWFGPGGSGVDIEVATSTWRKIWARGVAPAGTVAARFLLYVRDATGTATAQFDAITIRQQNEAGTGRDAVYAATTTIATAGSNTWGSGSMVGLTGDFAFVVRSDTRRIKLTLSVSGYAGGAQGRIETRLHITDDGTSALILDTSAKPIYYNTMTQHQSWTLTWVLQPGSLGPPGTACAVQAQIQSPTGSAASFSMDTNDSYSIVAEEID